LNFNVSAPQACFPQYIPGWPFGTTPAPNPEYDPTYKLGCTSASSSQVYPVYPSPPPAFQYSSVIDNITDGAKARYDGLLIRAETKSAPHGLYALVSYTWSRTFDSGMSDGDGTTPGAQFWPLPGSQRPDWGLSQLNLNDQFTASVLYELPFGKGKHYGGDWNAVEDGVLGGWQVNLIEKATSGFPLFLVDSNNQSGVNFQWNGTPLNRLNETCNPHLSHPTVSEWFNTKCFSAPPLGELGDASRAPVSGPRFVNTDFSAFKNFRIHEGYNLQFRSEFFNLFNHAQFGLTGNGVFMQDINSPSTFGVVNETVNNPRVVQFALRMDF